MTYFYGFLYGITFAANALPGWEEGLFGLRGRHDYLELYYVMIVYFALVLYGISYARCDIYYSTIAHPIFVFRLNFDLLVGVMFGCTRFYE